MQNTMIKVMSFSPGVRTMCAFDCVSIIWFISAVSIGSEGLELQATSIVVAECGKNVTLPCNISLSGNLDIKLFGWLGENTTVCQYEKSKPEIEDVCELMMESPNYRLSLTLTNVMPLNEGRYLCKLRSNMGVSSATTVVKVKGCLQSSHSSINETHAECRFKGVASNSTIQWYQGDVDLTVFASTWKEEVQHGLYNVFSTINIEKGNPRQPYNCSLTPYHGRVFASQAVHTANEPGSSGNRAKLLWICFMVEIMMIKSLL
ncbi:uncharacterized protein LOC113140253 [Mastacembelus armatus]|uniref:uncharacterized protein LOC113140253 n=1 Tax=Mastacembelus armatus TaxID=205130 RepID=UPI000E46020B|nr:uncharacterized protein LOC113140253 [Mastacembelus armatus]